MNGLGNGLGSAHAAKEFARNEPDEPDPRRGARFVAGFVAGRLALKMA